MEAETVGFLDFVCTVSWAVWYENPRDPFLECSHPTVSPTESGGSNGRDWVQQPKLAARQPPHHRALGLSDTNDSA